MKFLRCPLCKSDRTSFLFTSINQHGRHVLDADDRFNIRQCNDCQVVFLQNITVNDRYFKKYYNTGKYYSSGVTTNNFFIQQAVHTLESFSLKRKQSMILSFFLNHAGKINILDIGCGDGKFLASLDSAIFERKGIEINPDGYEQAKKRGLTVYKQDPTNIAFKQKFDVITLWHVTEHLDKPVETFKKVRSLLTPDGIVIFAMPNTDSLGFKIGKANWFHLDSPRHLMLYDHIATNTLLKKSDLRLQKTINEFYDFPLDLLWSIRNSWVKLPIYLFYPIIKYVDRETQTYIAVRN